MYEFNLACFPQPSSGILCHLLALLVVFSDTWLNKNGSHPVQGCDGFLAWILWGCHSCYGCLLYLWECKWHLFLIRRAPHRRHILSLGHSSHYLLKNIFELPLLTQATTPVLPGNICVAQYFSSTAYVTTLAKIWIQFWELFFLKSNSSRCTLMKYLATLVVNNVIYMLNEYESNPNSELYLSNNGN